MKTEAKIVSLAAIIILIISSGCNSSNGKADKKGGMDKLAFVEASQGLPSSGLWRQSIDFHDLNDDGYMDILAPPPRHGGERYKGPVVWYGNGKGQWKESLLDVPPNTTYDYGAVKVFDFDGNGAPGIALAMHATGLKVLKGTGKGKYEDFSEGLTPFKNFASRALVCADFNGDGISDIAAVSEGKFGKAFPNPSGIRICYRGDKEWKCAPAAHEKSESSELFADQIAVGDVNGDGKTDLAIASLVKMKNLIVWLNEGNGRFVPFNKGLSQEKIYSSVAFEDLNGDGRDDLVASISGFGRKGFMGVKAFLSKADGFEDMSDGLPVDEGYTAVTAGDLNGDGKAEIIGGTTAGGVKIFEQKENHWEVMETTGLPVKGMRNIYGIYCQDLNDDGYQDIVFNYASGDEDLGGIKVFLNRNQKE
jgi:hypothetical protein